MAEHLHGFLQSFRDSEWELIAEEDFLPHRLSASKVTRKELKGDCYGWIQDYLSRIHCPPRLSPAITDITLSRVTRSALEMFVVENTIAAEVPELAGQMQSPEYLDSSRLVRHTLNSIKLVLREWCSQTPEIVSEHPVLLPSSIYFSRNKKRRMEDRHIELQNLWTLTSGSHMQFSPVSLFAVFDGHGGAEAADYTTNHLPFLMLDKAETSGWPADKDEQLLFLSSSIRELNKNFLARAVRERITSGCTATVVLVHQGEVFGAWMGDSCVVAFRDRKAWPLTSPHHPQIQSEFDQIKEKGGCVLEVDGVLRVGGVIAISRSIGDLNLSSCLIQEPETFRCSLEDGWDFLVIASDGLWDGLEASTAADLAYQYLDEHRCVEGLAEHLGVHASQAGSTDNITVIVVLLKPTETILGAAST